MPQTPEANAFLARLATLEPDVPLDGVLAASTEDESQLRQLFATDKAHERLKDPHVGLVDVFDATPAIRRARPRVVEDDDDLAARHVMPLCQEQRLKSGAPCMVDRDEFVTNFKIFTEGSLAQLDWSNVVVAGGSVLACLLPVPETYKESKRTLRKWFHSEAYPTSDVDLFLWGLTAEEAEVKMKNIYEAVRDTVPWDVTCVRTKHAISIHSQYPYRSVQIVLRLYSSPAEILAGFDVDAPCCAYDGTRVWANPRAIVAMMRQANTVDMTRRSPSYEVRLAKYASRNFEVYVPDLRRSDIDPTIYERSITRVEGLARLLVLEKLSQPEMRVAYLDQRRHVRGRPQVQRPWQRRARKYKGDLKSSLVLSGLVTNDYDSSTLHIPYGPGWHARRIDQHVYKIDLGMNSPHNPKNKERTLHRHPAFFGTMAECVEDCCGACPAPVTPDEVAQQSAEDGRCVRGRAAFLAHDPGRQTLSGSFRPLDGGAWSVQAYVGTTERLFAAIVADDADAVSVLLAAGADPNRRDHAGRAPLHVAVLAGAGAVAVRLVDAGARMSARLVDGRTALHLAAQLGMPGLIEALLARSAQNVVAAEEGSVATSEEDKDKEADEERPSSDDDWSSDDADEERSRAKKDGATKDAPADAAASGEVPEDVADEPDVLDINLPDWDLGFTPLDFAVASGSIEALDVLLMHGADPAALTTGPGATASVHPLTLTGILEDEGTATRLATRLINAGARSSTADNNSLSLLHRLVLVGKASLVTNILAADPQADVALNHPMFEGWYPVAMYPLVSAISTGNWALCVVLLAHGAKLVISEEDISKAEALHDANSADNMNSWSHINYPRSVHMPLEVAMAAGEQLVHLLLSAGADVQLGTLRAYAKYASVEDMVSLLDCARRQVELVDEQLRELHDVVPAEPAAPDVSAATWKEFWAVTLQQVEHARRRSQAPNAEEAARRKIDCEHQKAYWTDVVQALEAAGAKTWSELFPEDSGPGRGGRAATAPQNRQGRAHKVGSTIMAYLRRRTTGRQAGARESLPSHLVASYDELFQAVWSGDHQRIQAMCLPPSDGSSGSSQGLEVAVEACSESDADCGFTFAAYTPVHVALVKRRWDTAHLLLAIAAGQYKPEEESEPKFRTVLAEDDDDPDSDNGSETTAEGNAAQFNDLATARSPVVSCVSPEEILNCCIMPISTSDRLDFTGVSLLERTIYAQDLDAFEQISKIYSSLPEPVEPPAAQLIALVMRIDIPELLDRLIRYTGVGAPQAPAVDQGLHEDDADEDGRTNDEDAKDTALPADPASRPVAQTLSKRVYHGLDVHGKKRKDLARQYDPDAQSQWEQGPEMPLLWRAVLSNAPQIVEYLSGPRAIEAYKHYASNGRSRHAAVLRALDDISSSYREWMGWKANTFGQSVLIAAISSGADDRVPMLKILFGAQPQIMVESLHIRVKPSHSRTPLLMAVARGVDVGTIQYLLDHGASPSDRDEGGSNVYHCAAACGNKEVLALLVRVLPQELSSELLLQRTKGELATPLHLAAVSGKAAIASLLVEGGLQPQALLARNADGAIPLHLAVRTGDLNTTLVLLKAARTADLDVNVENGVGDTPLEIAQTQYWLAATRGINRPSVQHRSNAAIPVCVDVAEWERRLTALRRTAVELAQSGRLQEGTPLHGAITSFIQRIERKLARKESESECKEQEERPLKRRKLVDDRTTHTRDTSHVDDAAEEKNADAMDPSSPHADSGDAPVVPDLRAIAESAADDKREAKSHPVDLASRAQTLAVVGAEYRELRQARCLVHLADVQRAVRRRLDENPRLQEEERVSKDSAERQVAGLETKPAKRVAAPWNGFRELM